MFLLSNNMKSCGLPSVFWPSVTACLLNTNMKSYVWTPGVALDLALKDQSQGYVDFDS